MKLSFSLPPKSKKPSTTTTTSAFESLVPKPNGQNSKQFVTEFDPSEPSSQTLIIPPKPNEYRPFQNINISSSDSNPLQFELEPDNIDPDPGSGSISYGLNVRQSNSSNGVSRGGDPMLVKYKEDMGRLPEVEGFDEFQDMPVEGFGAALLAGYGWKEGRGIGRNAKEDVKIVEYKKWTGKEGLGFDKDIPDRVSKGGKDSINGDQSVNARERRDTTRGNLSRGGRDEEVKDSRKHRGSEEDVQEESEDVRMEERGSRERRGKAREDISSSRRSDRDGRDEGSKDSSRKKERKRRGREDAEEQSEDERREKARENISSSRRNGRDGRDEESKDSRRKERKRRGSEDVEKETEDVRMEAREVDDRDGSSSRERRDKASKNIISSRRSDRDERDEESKGSRKKEKKRRGSEDVEKQSEVVRERGSEQLRKSDRVTWLFSHIRVRVISKAVKGGQLYLKKGEVVDVVGPSCDILMDESRELVQGVSQEYLETALPKRGGPVLVLFGKHKGVYGNLMEKDTDKETGVVRDADNHEMLNVRLDQIAEFIGDPSYIGY